MLTSTRVYHISVLVTCYVPNAWRSIWEQCKYVYIDDRPTTNQPLIWKIANGDISAKGHPIHFVFRSMVGFLGSADQMAPYPVQPNPRWRPASSVENLEWIHLC